MEWSLFSLEQRQVLRLPAAAPRTHREASKEMEPGPSQSNEAEKQEVVTLN